MNLRKKVNLAVLAVFVLSISALVLITYLGSRNNMEKMLAESHQAIANDNAANVNTWIQSKLSVIEAGANDLVKYPDTAKDYTLNLMRILSPAGGFRKVYVGYENGISLHSDDFIPPADYDPRKRSWYIKAKALGKPAVSDPYIAASTGKLTLSFMAPILRDNAVGSVLSSDITLEYVVQKILSIKIGNSGYAFIIDKDGKILVHPNQDFVLKKKIQDLSTDLTEFSKQLTVATNGHTKYRVDGEEKLLSYAQIPSTGWILCISANKSEVFAPVTKQLRTLAICGLLFLTIGIVGIILLLNRLLKPLTILCERVSDLTEGEGDLTKRIDVGNRQDEIGLLADKLNRFIDNIRDIIRQISVASQSLAAESSDLNATSSSISVGAQAVAAQTVSVATASEEMSSTAVDIANNCHMLADNAQLAADATKSGFQVVTSTVNGIRDRGRHTKENASSISSLGERSEQISAIVATIEDIADQTNLLALNAAIEAARAGEQGRGFAVVADEVRALAERTTRATKEISDMIKAIQQETKAAIVSMEDGVRGTERGIEEAAQLEDALSKILDQINAVTMQVSQIATAAEEQTATTNEITSNIHQVTTVVHQTAEGAHKTAQTAGKLSGLSEELQQIVGKFKL